LEYVPWVFMTAWHLDVTKCFILIGSDFSCPKEQNHEHAYMEEIIVKILTFVAAIVKDFKGFKGFLPENIMF